MRYRSKQKISANVDPYIVSESLRLQKRLGIKTFSNYVEYALRSVVKDPEQLIRSEMIHSQREFTFWRETYENIQELKEAMKEEERFPSNPSKEEEQFVMGRD